MSTRVSVEILKSGREKESVGQCSGGGGEGGGRERME